MLSGILLLAEGSSEAFVHKTFFLMAYGAESPDRYRITATMVTSESAVTTVEKIPMTFDCSQPVNPIPTRKATSPRKSIFPPRPPNDIRDCQDGEVREVPVDSQVDAVTIIKVPATVETSNSAADNMNAPIANETIRFLRDIEMSSITTVIEKPVRILERNRPCLKPSRGSEDILVPPYMGKCTTQCHHLSVELNGC
jgi:hypothetical protein